MSSKRTLLAVAVVTVLPSLPRHARAATGDVVTSFPSSFPSPDGLMWDGSFLWATDCSYSRIDKVDPASGQVVGTIDIAGVNSDELAWDGEAMWISDHTATEMPGMNAPPPRLYRVDPASQAVLSYFDAPGQAKYPMGVAWDGEAVWNVDTWDKLIYRLDPGTGAVLRSLPAPANGSCGMTWDGACLWLSDAATDGLVYHIDPANGEVLRTFAGPGGPGHQATGVAWDGRHLWVHDEAVGRAAIHKLEIEDITEAGRCAGAFQVPDPSPPASAPAEEATASAGCSVYSLRAADRATPWAVGTAAALLAGVARRRRSTR